MNFDDGQMSRLDESAAAKLVDRTMRRLGERHPTVSDAVLRECIEAWISDARAMGLRSQRQVIAWLERRLRQGALREPLETRLPVYLVLHHEALLKGLDATAVARRVCTLARECSVHQEEGVTWLAVILLAGRHRGPSESFDWIRPMLQASHRPEEERLRDVHARARSLGWFPAHGRIA